MKNELKKIEFVKILIIFLAYSFIINILLMNLSESYTLNNWREKAMEEKIVAEQMLTLSTLDEHSIELWNDVLFEIEYCLDNNIPYNVLDVFYYVKNLGGMGTFIYILTIVVVSKIISIEDNNNSWKNIYSTPTNIKIFMLKKVETAFVCIIIMLAILLATSFVWGFVLYGGPKGLENIVIYSGTIIEIDIVEHMICVLSVIAVKCLFYGALVMFIMSLHANFERVAIVVALLLLFGGEMFCEWVSSIFPDRVHEILPFEYIAMPEATFYSITDIREFSLVCLAYICIFSISCIILFKRKL